MSDLRERIISAISDWNTTIAQEDENLAIYMSSKVNAAESYRSLADRIFTLIHDELAHLRSFNDHAIHELHNVEQRLGEALGYPVVDHTICQQCDPVRGCTCGNPIVCIGEHTPSSLSLEAANRIKRVGHELPKVPELRWDGDKLKLGDLLVGWVYGSHDDNLYGGTTWSRVVVMDVSGEEARAAVEAAVRKALGWAE